MLVDGGNMMSKLRFGIDIGGSTLRIILFDGTAAMLSCRIALSQPTPAFVVDQIAATCQTMRATAGIAESALLPLGVGIAAMLQGDSGFISNAPNIGWIDIPFKQLLIAALGPRYFVIVENDVNAIAWGEFHNGAAVGCRDTLTVYFGTGIGAGVISNAQLVQGAVCAGEIGHTKIAWDATALACACGSRGCIEAYAGGAALQARIQRELGEAASAVTLGLAGTIATATPAHVDQAAQAGDVWALRLWSDIAAMLGVVLGNAIAIVGSERLIVGGGMMSRTPLLFERTAAAVMIAAPTPMLQRLRIVRAALGDTAGALGAADLASCAQKRSCR